MDLHIFDKQNQEQDKNNLNISWDGLKINFILEKNKKKIRSNYINIINSIINNKSNNHNYLKIKDINLIQMSSINEKNPFKSNGIYNCLKFLVIEELVKKNKIKTIYYHGSVSAIHKSIELFCNNSNLIYSKKKNNFFIKKSKFLYFLKGTIFFCIQFLKNYRLKGNFKNYSEISFFSYFVHFKSISGLKFKSNLWGDLPKYLNINKKKVNWFHFYIPSDLVRNSDAANKIKKKLNYNKFENHNFINSFFTLQNTFKSFYLYIIIFIKNTFFLKSNLNFFINKYSKTNFYYFLEEDYLSSMFGQNLIYNLINILTFDELLKKIPKQKYGVYIIENQSWEYCFIKLWKKYKHGQIIAYFNSSIRFWDLRYLKTSNELNSLDHNPDIYFHNSKIFKKEAEKIGYPKKKMFLVEALRYNNLKPIKKIYKNKKILIIGDIIFEETIYLLNFVKKTLHKLKNYQFNLKPHPTMTHKSINLFKINFPFIKITNTSSQNFSKFEFVICSNGTSAILDCLALKLNFCSIKPVNSLNLYPLENFQKNYQVNNHSKMIDKIKKKNNLKKTKIFQRSKKLKKFISFLK